MLTDGDAKHAELGTKRWEGGSEKLMRQETKDTEEVSLPPIHDVEANGDVVQEQFPADPAHLFSSPLPLGSRHWFQASER